jgi:hypothetical protein
MTEEEFDLEFPHGSLKRQEEVARLERGDEPAESPQPEEVPETPDDGKIPEELWRGNAG